MTTTFTKTELAEWLSIAQAENKELKADNSILKRENKRMHEERDGLYNDLRERDDLFNDLRDSSINENINSVVWYAWNYDYNFIAKCWENQGSLILHLEDKFSKLVRSNGKTAFFLFLAELDDTNRSILYDFILRTFSKKKGFLQ